MKLLNRLSPDVSSIACTLPPELFSSTFPFHFVLDRTLTIVQSGEVLQRLISTPFVGGLFNEYFRISRPKIQLEFDGIKQQSRALFMFELLQSDLQLKGQMVYVEAQDVLFFLGSPWVTDPKQLAPLGLKLKDFAIHDPITDFLFLVQAQNAALNESKKLTEELSQQKAQLQNALEIKEELAAIAQSQANQLKQMIEDLQQAQVQLIQTEKMSSLGQMVAGVAHEINNPVNFIHGNLLHIHDHTHDLLELVQLYRRSYPEPENAIAEHLEEIDVNFLQEDLPKVLASMEIGTTRIREIVKSLRNFSRLDEEGKKAVDLQDGIESTLLIVQNQLKATEERLEIQVIRKYDRLPKVECYPGQLNQVFLNLIVNSIDALNEKSLADVEQKLGIITITTQALHDRIVIRISDNGLGIPEQIQSKLFDPFFTTKPVGKGTGLGLSISYQIVTEQHGGTIECFSTVGEGTEFRIRLPIEQSRICE